MYDVIYLNVITAGSPIHAGLHDYPRNWVLIFTRINPRKLRNIGRDVQCLHHIKRPVLVRLSQFLNFMLSYITKGKFKISNYTQNPL